MVLKYSIIAGADSMGSSLALASGMAKSPRASQLTHACSDSQFNPDVSRQSQANKLK